MSRNADRRTNTPVKIRLKTRTRRDSDVSSSIDLSDDDGYSGVDEISDDEDDDEEDVAAVEEENIMSRDTDQTPRPQPNEGQFYFEDNHDDDDDEDTASWNGIVSEADYSQASDFYQEATAFNSDHVVERHVHFDVPSSDSDSTETEDDHADLFPDIFVSQNSLDPAFRKEIEEEDDDSSNGSYWDHGHESDAEEVPETAVEEVQDLDGYETDGDTTEEDIPDPPLPRKKSRRPSLPMSDSDSEIEVTVKPQRGHPRSGRFRLDRSDKKPIAVLNPLTRKMMIFTPHKRRQLDLSPEHFDFTSWNAQQQSSPLLSNSANLMLSAMFPADAAFGGDFNNTTPMGPAEAFFPFIPSEANGTPEESCSSHGSARDEDDGEKKLTFDDFIAWGDDDSSGDENWQPSSTPVRPTSADGDILSHLNSKTVGAFRRNQINQQLILSRQATQDSLAFSGPLNFTTIKGLKSDRFDTAGVPLTPVRRHRKQTSDLKSPLETVSSKRKASAEVSGHHHKRPTSISEVKSLRI